MRTRTPTRQAPWIHAQRAHRVPERASAPVMPRARRSGRRRHPAGDWAQRTQEGVTGPAGSAAAGRPRDKLVSERRRRSREPRGTQAGTRVGTPHRLNAGCTGGCARMQAGAATQEGELRHEELASGRGTDAEVRNWPGGAPAMRPAASFFESRVEFMQKEACARGWRTRPATWKAGNPAVPRD